ncbi:hypothetical protein [Conexibacter sp. CPCC 206217]|uniref:hypothetical protein n=1 Tax=Conexibacter sp. CPCC 206217 TaxID=3064574 RepID=UPI0027164A20|nr:hypothetical protein [Conexibacter sp. CPCC 206217]MDO8213855.1 hypothetical protein [Conexibacter sp. CPCC 206217]
MRRALVLAAAFAALALGLAGPATGGAGAVTFGSRLDQTANLPFGCEARPYPGFGGGIQLLATNVTSCMWFAAPLTTASTYVPGGDGRVTAARVRSGANPAPLRISIISSGSGLCCTHRSSGPIFTPAPNAVTTVPLDLPASTGLDPNRRGGQYNDIVVVSAVGPGSLPVHDFGTHGTFDLSAPAASFLHPELTNGNSNTDVGWMDGYEVLLQVDWEATPPPAPVLPQTPPVPPAVQPPPVQPQPQQPAAPVLSRLGLRGRTLTLSTSAPVTVTARLERCTTQRRRPRRTVCTGAGRLRAVARRAGAVRFALPGRLSGGSYRVTVTAPGANTLVKRLTVPAARTRARR